jgi:hypothetical protein
MKYRKKPVVIEAIKWEGNNLPEIILFMQGNTPILGTPNYPKSLVINTLEGAHYADVNDWIIKGIKGEFYPCKPDIFKKTYEKVEE